MREGRGIEPTTLVDDLLMRYPSTARVFIESAMLCVGCAFGRFHTVEDVARYYHVPVSTLLTLLQEAVDSDPSDAGDERAGPT